VRRKATHAPLNTTKFLGTKGKLTLLQLVKNLALKWAELVTLKAASIQDFGLGLVLSKSAMDDAQCVGLLRIWKPITSYPKLFDLTFALY
jgi:hypothetical protein